MIHCNFFSFLINDPWCLLSKKKLLGGFKSKFSSSRTRRSYNWIRLQCYLTFFHKLFPPILLGKKHHLIWTLKINLLSHVSILLYFFFFFISYLALLYYQRKDNKNIDPKKNPPRARMQVIVSQIRATKQYVYYSSKTHGVTFFSHLVSHSKPTPILTPS